MESMELPLTLQATGDVAYQEGDVTVRKINDRWWVMDVQATSNKFVRVSLFLGLLGYLIAKSGIILRDSVHEFIATNHPPLIMTVAFLSLLIIVFAGIAGLLCQFALPKRLVFDVQNKRCRLRHSIFVSHTIPFDRIESVDLASYAIRNRWTSFVSFATERLLPRRLILCGTAKGRASSADALTAGRPLAMIIAKILGKDFRRYENVSLGWCFV